MADVLRAHFRQLVQRLSDICEGHVVPDIEIRADCHACEFKASSGEFSGWHRCLESAGVRDPQPGELVFDLWDYRKKDDRIEQGTDATGAAHQGRHWRL